jgi:CheY-like chemotaxis protein
VRDTFPKDIRFNATVAPDTWTVLGDPTQLYQVLLNLCVNARDAMPHGGTLSIEMKNVTLDEHYATANLKSATGPHVLIEVTDSGTGIPQDLIEKIFDPFFTTKEEGKGTGLGLSTVMAIVKGHDGFVNVYSEPGKGTIFRLYLPALTTQAAAKLEDETAGLPRGEGEIVLLIDDETSILTITRQTLEAFGYQVLTADNGAAAVGIYAQHKNEIAVVLTDMMMPLMDGVATIQALKTINPEVRIIAASGLNTSSHAARAAGSEVRHFLPKPYNARTLLEMIRRVLDEGKTR